MVGEERCGVGVSGVFSGVSRRSQASFRLTIRYFAVIMHMDYSVSARRCRRYGQPQTGAWATISSESGAELGCSAERSVIGNKNKGSLLSWSAMFVHSSPKAYPALNAGRLAVFQHGCLFVYVCVCLCLLTAAGCLILPASTSPGDDGRVLLFLDLDPSHVNAGIWTSEVSDKNGKSVGSIGSTILLKYRVGDEDPVSLVVTWSDGAAALMRDAGIKFLYLQRPLSEFDLVGAMVPGGTEVWVSMWEATRSASMSFKVDGTVKLRLKMIDPSLPGLDSDWVLERIL